MATSEEIDLIAEWTLTTLFDICYCRKHLLGDLFFKKIF